MKTACIKVLISSCFYWLFPAINHACYSTACPPHVEQLSTWLRHPSPSSLVLSPGLHPHPPGTQLPSLRNFESLLFPESWLGLGYAFKTLPGPRCWSMFSASRSLQDTHRPAHLRLPTPVNMKIPHGHIQICCWGFLWLPLSHIKCGFSNLLIVFISILVFNSILNIIIKWINSALTQWKYPFCLYLRLISGLSLFCSKIFS